MLFSDIMNEEHMALDPSRIAAQVVSGVGFFRCRDNYYSKAGGERINDSSWFMGHSRNWINNWGWHVVVVGIGATILVLIGLEIVSRIFKVQFLFPQNITVQMCINKHEAVQQILETLQVKGIPILSYEVEASQQGSRNCL